MSKIITHIGAALAAALLALTASAQVPNPAVTQDNISTTVCVHGWTATVRPPVSYTNRIKRQLMATQGLPWSDAHLYELDHWMPIEDGGHPSDLGNLRLQLWSGPDGARAKDVVETHVHRELCAGRMTLAAARACFTGDWHACEKTQLRN